MNIQAHLTDPLLCLLGFLFLILWAGIKYGLSQPTQNGKSLNHEAVAATFFRVLCGFILIFAGGDKLGNASTFTQIIINYQILPPDLVPLAGVVIPWLEFFAGLSLIFGFCYRGAALIFCLLMGFYALAISFDLLRGVDINCGCGLTNPTENATWWSVIRDLEFFSIGFIVLVLPRSYAALDHLNDQ
jgi:putative oxidoreductase